MLRRRLILAAAPLTLAGLVLAGCATQTAIAADPDTSSDDTSTAETTAAVDSDLSASAVLAADADVTVVDDDEWSETDAVDIALDGDTASSDADAVTVDGSTVTITDGGVFRLSGSLDGQLVVAAVVPRDGAELDFAAIEAEMRKRLSSYKVPRAYVALTREEVPMLHSNKVARREIVAMMAKRLGRDAA